MSLHDILAVLGLVALVVLVLAGHLGGEVVVTFLGGLALRSPLDREVSP